MGRKKKVCLAVLAVLVVVLAGLVIWQQGRDDPGAAGGIVLDASAESWEGPADSAQEETGIRIPGYDTIYFPAGEQQVQLTLYNPEKNTCYFTFSLYLEGEDEPLYTSDYVEPGKAIREETLSRGLEAGEYTLSIRIATYDPVTQTEKNGATVQAPLVVS